MDLDWNVRKFFLFIIASVSILHEAEIEICQHFKKWLMFYKRAHNKTYILGVEKNHWSSAVDNLFLKSLPSFPIPFDVKQKSVVLRTMLFPRFLHPWVYYSKFEAVLVQFWRVMFRFNIIHSYFPIDILYALLTCWKFLCATTISSSIFRVILWQLCLGKDVSFSDIVFLWKSVLIMLFKTIKF